MQPTAAILSAHFPKEEAARVRQCAKRKGMTTSRYLYTATMEALSVEDWVAGPDKKRRCGNLRIIKGGKR
jgi:hypothetical protein